MNTKQFNQMLIDNSNLSISIMLPNGEFVPNNFHITEIGLVDKKFVDCGGTPRNEAYCVLQVWVANDKDHRLNSTKLRAIMKAGSFIDGELPLKVEYGSDTISQYLVNDVEVTPKGLLLILGNKPTSCLAPDKCGVKGCC